MLGVLINMGAIIAGASAGLILKKGIPEHISDMIMKGMGLCIIYVGISGMLDNENAMVMVISMAVGTLIGSALKLQARLESFGISVEMKLNKDGFAKGFVNASMVFVIGAMAIVGSLQAGLVGDNTTLITKAALDGITSIIFAATMGYGVIFSCIPVGIWQGGIVLLATVLAPLIDDPYIIAEINAVGSLLIFGLGLNMLGITKLKVMDMMPAIFFPILLCQFM